MQGIVASRADVRKPIAPNIGGVMAQTKRKRSTKHRGNAAGMIESRGRTGRKLTDDERKGDAKSKARAGRLDRLNRPPTWRSAINRAGFAAVFFAVALIVLFKNPVSGTLAITCVVFVFYIPLGYYTDLWMFNRRQRGKGKT
jgi:hypothetical protein